MSAHDLHADVRQSVTVGRRNALVVVLAAHSGLTDAIGFVGLGGAFTSVMTGNMVLIGVAAAKPDGALALRAVAAVLAFAAGCAIGAWVAAVAGPAGEIWPIGVTRTLRLQFAGTLVFAAGWWATGPHRGTTVELLLLMVNAICLGMQSSAVQRFGVQGLSTTYLTGTLTSLVVRLAKGERHPELALSARLLTALIAGAALGATLADRAQDLAPIAPLLGLGSVLLLSRAGQRAEI